MPPESAFLPVHAAVDLVAGVTGWFGMTYATQVIAEAIIEVRQIANPDDLGEVLTKSIYRTWSARYTGSPLPNTTSGAAALRFYLVDLAFRKTSPPVPLDFACMLPTFLKDAITSCSQGQLLNVFSPVKSQDFAIAFSLI